MSLFSHQDYKQYLQEMIQKNKGTRGYQTQLANAAGCQRAYISQVVGGSAHLTFDQAVGLCKFWNLNTPETEYFIELLQLARAGTLLLRAHVSERLQKLRAGQSEISNKFKTVTQLEKEQQARYYSSWIYAAIHVLTSIPDFQKDVSMAQRLGLQVQQVKKVLSELREMNLIQSKGERWSPTERNLFLPKHSQMVPVHHTAWHLRAVADIHERPDRDSLHYSTLHAMSYKDIEKFKEMILAFLKETKALVEPSPEEEIVCFMLDFFRL